MPQTNVSTKRAASFLFFYVKKHLAWIIGGMILLVAVDLCQLVIPRIVQRTIDALGDEHFSQPVILSNSLKIVGLAFSMIILRFFWRMCIVGPSRKIETQIRQDMFSHLMTLSFSYFNKTKTGDLMALAINDLNAIRMACGLALIGLTDALFMGSMSVIFMLSINVKLTIFTIIPMPIIVIIMLRFGGMIQSRFKDVQESFGAISSRAQEAFSGIRVIKGFVQEARELEGFVTACDDYVEKNMHLVKIWGFFFPIITFLASLSLSILYLLGGRYVIEAKAHSRPISFVRLLHRPPGVLPMMAIGWVFNMLQRGIASSKRILELMDTKPDVAVTATAHTIEPRVTGGIALRDLSFRYQPGGRDVLKHLTLDIPQGTSRHHGQTRIRKDNPHFSSVPPVSRGARNHRY